MKEKTIKEFLHRLGNTLESTEEDEQLLLMCYNRIRAINPKVAEVIPEIKITCGIVYGFIKEPINIHSFSKHLIETLEKAVENKIVTNQ